MHYQAPLEDMAFLLDDVFDLSGLYGSIPEFAEFDSDLYQAVLEEAGKFCESVLLPINRSGDEEGCRFEAGDVITPAGFREAYRAYVEGGWQSLTGDPRYGGQGLPKALHVLVEEMIYSCNTSFCLYGSLTAGAYHLLHAHGPEAIRNAYLPKMISGEWSGSMCLTEAHAGSDLGLLKTRAEPDGDDRYRLNGSKIFITGGEHDLADNIIHLVLARLPDAPPGPKGISLFLVPKFHVTDAGGIGERNGIACGAIEHKMGIKASSTCVMNLDDAVGYLIGPPNEGLKCMFTMMNLERLSIGLQGVGLGEMAYQQAYSYARERRQGRTADSGIEPAAIIRHKDVKRMLLTMRAWNEAGRALAVWLGTETDLGFHSGDAAVRERSATLAALLTPVAKAFFTDMGFETTNLGLQCFGGHGYVREWGMEQLVRDCRIAQIYEGTNGIQALDLAGRKILADQGAGYGIFEQQVQAFIDGNPDETLRADIIAPLQAALADLSELTRWLLDQAATDADELQAAAVEYLHSFGLVTYAYLWARMAVAARDKPPMADDKRRLARFYMARLLPRLQGLKASVMAGVEAF